METLEIKRLIREIGESVHSMNTIAVGLSKLNANNCDIPEGLEISWKPNDLETSKIKSRNYAERAAIIYTVESYFDYLDSISKNPFWNHPEINFNGEEKKAIKAYNFLNQIPAITDDVKILAEFACHWRNKIVHSSASNAKMTNDKVGRIRQLREYVYENYHHFDVIQALDNYENKRMTLKDSSTLITILIKSARQIDEFFFSEFSMEQSIARIQDSLKSNDCFEQILKQQKSSKKERQLRTIISASPKSHEKVKKDQKATHCTHINHLHFHVKR